MQGIKNIILGIVLTAAGAAILATVDLSGSVLIYAVWGLVACGVILFAGGLYRAMGPGSAGADATEVYKSDTIARLLLQSTIETALADGDLNDKEVEMISAAFMSVMPERLDRQSVYRLAKLIEDKGDESLSDIHSEGRMLNLDARKAVIGACVKVAKADGTIDVRETAAMTAIARRLDFSEDETQTLIAELMENAEQG
jgi:tellurite resistance protein